MVEIGQINKLKVIKKLDFGVYLDGGDDNEILMPIKYVPVDCNIDDELEVFVYLDSEDRIIATTEKPFARVGDFALLKVVSVNQVGAFLDWGLVKDLLVPFREQTVKMAEGRHYLVYIYLDEESNRIVASSKLDKFLDKQPLTYTVGQEVDLIICNQTDIGYKAIVNKAHWGILYKNEVFQKIERGQSIKGFIKKIREDNKIDLILTKPGYTKVNDISQRIISELEDNDGFLEITDKSPSTLIYKIFGVSKKAYKMAVGSLYKSKIIAIEREGIRLIKK